MRRYPRLQIPGVSPDPRPIAAGELNADLRALRPSGTRDWLLVYTHGGLGDVTYPGGKIVMTGGDVLLVAPGTPQDYGSSEVGGRWHQIWAHFHPDPGMLDWIDWPRPSSGLFYVRTEGKLQREVFMALRQMVRAMRVAHPRQAQLAMNALARAVLTADAANPNRAAPYRDARIRAAIELMSARLHEPLSIDRLADAAGVSRSRFSALFKRAVGISPAKFVERQRLAHAKHLLEVSNLTLKEIAHQLGFNTPFYLSLRFKQRFGVSPKQYRKDGPKA